MGSGLLQVASTFTATPIRDSLRTASVEAGIAEDLGFALYAQMSEYLLQPTSAHPQIIGSVVLLRLEDWLRQDLKSSPPDSSSKDWVRRQLLSRSDEFVQQLTTFSQGGHQVWALVCPSTGWIATRHNLITLCRTYATLIVARIRKLSVTVVDCPAFLANGQLDDHSADRLGQMPYLQEGFDQLGEFLAAEIARTLQRQDSTPPGAFTGSAELAQYLSGLQVEVKLALATANDRTHVDRLLRTVAGFSLTGEKPSIPDSEVEQLLQSRSCLLVTVSDRLSDYGPSGFVLFQERDDALVVDGMALSCIVLGKQVEYAVLSALARCAADHHLQRIVFEYTPSARNEPMHEFLQSVADPEPGARYEVPVPAVEGRLKAAAVSFGAWSVELVLSHDDPGVLS